MRNWENLSDYEFEGVVGDLLGAELSIRFERFTRGADSGIDLRHLNRGTGPDIVQAKHYKGSSFSQLRQATEREVRRLQALDAAPATYRLVTSKGLTPGNKATLAGLLTGYVSGADAILGRDDVEQLLDEHPEVERRHVKLWLAGGAQLAAMMSADVLARSRALVERIDRALPLYVQSPAFSEARERLRRERVLVVAGPPGVGKTTLAHMLIADAITHGFEPVEISEDVTEAWRLRDASTAQVFLFDDFLGRTFLGHLTRNGEHRLASFIDTIARSSNALLIMTTREYILQQRLAVSETLRRSGVEKDRFVLDLDSYDRVDRARILHNHVWHSSLDDSVLDELFQEVDRRRGYAHIVDHPNFTPRLIEYVTGLQRGHPVVLGPTESWLEFAREALDRPHDVWRGAVQDDLSQSERDVLYCLATMPQHVELRDAERAWAAYTGTDINPETHTAFEGALRVLADDLVSTTRRLDGGYIVRIAQPGLADYLQEGLSASADVAAGVLRRCIFWSQILTVLELLRDTDVRGESRERLARAVGEAFERCFDAALSVWWPADVGSWYPRRESLETRLRAAAEWAGDERFNGELLPLVRRQLAGCVEGWLRGRSPDFVEVEALDETLTGAAVGEASEKWSGGVRLVALRGGQRTEEWDAILRYVDAHDDAFTDAEKEDLTADLIGFVEGELRENLAAYEEPQWLDDLESLGWRVGADWSEQFEAAREELTPQWQAADHAHDLALEQWREEVQPYQRAEEAEVERIFRRDT